MSMTSMSTISYTYSVSVTVSASCYTLSYSNE